MHRFLGTALLLTFFAVTPSSTNYTLKSYDVGPSGGTSSSSNYSVQSGAGAQSGNLQSSSNYTAASNGRGVLDATTPPAPAFTNPSNYYDRLKLVLATGSNPTDTKYLIAVSTDNFVTTKFVQTDQSLGSSEALGNYQTYATWGGASGFYIIGLLPSTTYQVKVKALQGAYTGSGYGPSASAATVATQLSFGLTTTLTASPPFAVTFPSLTPGSVVNGSADALVGLSTNANNGGAVYIKDTANGLYSALANTTIASATTNLTSALSGYGAQVTSATQTSGGPFVSVSPYDGTGTTVGGLTTTLQRILSVPAPVTGASGTLRLMAKAADITPSSPDYSDTVTFVVAMSF